MKEQPTLVSERKLQSQLNHARANRRACDLAEGRLIRRDARHDLISRRRRLFYSRLLRLRQSGCSSQYDPYDPLHTRLYASRAWRERIFS